MGNKYYLDKNTLEYKIVENNWHNIFKQLAKTLSYGVLIAIVYWLFTFTGILPSVKTKLLSQVNGTLVNDLKDINLRFDSISNQLAEIQNRDDNFYRVISQLDPLSSTIRQAGFGGTNQYEHLNSYIYSELYIESNKKSDILNKQLKLQAQSYDTVYSSVKTIGDSIFAAPAIQPLSPYDFYRISSPFGYRVHPVTGTYIHHDGIDLAADIGKPIYATGSGKVISANGSEYGYGNRVIIDHGFGYKTLYAHLSKIMVIEGQTVKRGSVLGLVGNTGTSTGPHLHYEVIYKNTKMNPVLFYVNDLTDAEYKEMIKSYSFLN